VTRWTEEDHPRTAIARGHPDIRLRRSRRRDVDGRRTTSRRHERACRIRRRRAASGTVGDQLRRRRRCRIAGNLFQKSASDRLLAVTRVDNERQLNGRLAQMNDVLRLVDVHRLSLVICKVITSDQRILTKGLIATANFSRRRNVMWHRPIGSIAVRRSSGAVMPLLIFAAYNAAVG